MIRFISPLAYASFFFFLIQLFIEGMNYEPSKAVFFSVLCTVTAYTQIHWERIKIFHRAFSSIWKTPNSFKTSMVATVILADTYLAIVCAIYVFATVLGASARYTQAGAALFLLVVIYYYNCLLGIGKPIPEVLKKGSVPTVGTN